jgi:hypothetical protein
MLKMLVSILPQCEHNLMVNPRVVISVHIDSFLYWCSCSTCVSLYQQSKVYDRDSFTVTKCWDIYLHIYLKYGDISYRKSIEKFWNFSYKQKQCRNIMLKLSILKLTLNTDTLVYII